MSEGKRYKDALGYPVDVGDYVAFAYSMGQASLDFGRIVAINEIKKTSHWQQGVSVIIARPCRWADEDKIVTTAIKSTVRTVVVDKSHIDPKVIARLEVYEYKPKGKRRVEA